MATVRPEASKAMPEPRDQRAADTGDQHGPAALYRLYSSGGTLLYIGVTDNPDRRFKQHRDSKPWWPQVAQKTVEWYPSRSRALAIEAAAIEAETPAYNIEHNPVARQNPVSLHWPPAGMPADRVDAIQRAAETLPPSLAGDIQRAAAEAYTRTQRDTAMLTAAVQAAVTERGIQVEEWDVSTLDESIRHGYLGHYEEHKDGTRILVFPTGQDPAITLHAARTLLTRAAVTA